MENKKRPCIFTTGMPATSERCGNIKEHKAIFHRFGNEILSGIDGTKEKTIAIIEIETGKLLKLDPERITFTDK